MDTGRADGETKAKGRMKSQVKPLSPQALSDQGACARRSYGAGVGKGGDGADGRAGWREGWKEGGREGWVDQTEVHAQVL